MNEVNVYEVDNKHYQALKQYHELVPKQYASHEWNRIIIIEINFHFFLLFFNFLKVGR